MRSFEDVKRVFGSAESQNTFKLPLKLRRGQRDCTAPYFDPKDKELMLSKEDIQDMFDPVISKIISLINSQIMAADKEYGSPVITVGTHPRASFENMAKFSCLENFSCWWTSLFTLCPKSTSPML